jgi:hypothetical protein
MASLSHFQSAPMANKLSMSGKENSLKNANVIDTHSVEEALVNLIRIKASECLGLQNQIRELKSRHSEQEHSQMKQYVEKLVIAAAKAKHEHRRVSKIVELQVRLAALEVVVRDELAIARKKNSNKYNKSSKQRFCVRERRAKNIKKRTMARRQPWR